jgi:hypothetical protein
VIYLAQTGLIRRDTLVARFETEALTLHRDRHCEEP